jgi:hypothetical protein
MMGLRVITTANFLAGIGITDEDLGIGKVLEAHVVGMVVETLLAMMVYLGVVVGVVVGVIEVTTTGRGFQEAVGMIG